MFPVDAFRTTVGRFASILKQHGIRFHLTGGITSIAWGEPRMTQDIDVVIDNDAISAQIESFLATLATSDFLFEESSIRNAVERRGLFQLLDTKESLKLDVYARELIPGELDRSELTEVFEGMTLPIAGRADAAASKLVWINKGSHKNRRDFRKIFQSASEADRQQIRSLADQLELTDLLNRVLSEPDEINE